MKHLSNFQCNWFSRISVQFEKSKLVLNSLELIFFQKLNNTPRLNCYFSVSLYRPITVVVINLCITDFVLIYPRSIFFNNIFSQWKILKTINVVKVSTDVVKSCFRIGCESQREQNNQGEHTYITANSTTVFELIKITFFESSKGIHI